MPENSPGGAFPAELQQQTVIPEVSSQVSLSSSDANRIVCSQEIRDVIFSAEKGVSVKAVGKNAFVKFRITRKDDREVYSSTPTELFVVCGESVYNLIVLPKRIPSQTIRLSPGTEKIRQNAAIYGSLPFEKKVIAIIRAVYTGDIPEGFSVSTANRRIPLFKDLDLTQVRSFRVEGEGLAVDEFRVSSKKIGEELKIREKDFLAESIAARPVGIALDRHTLKQLETGRLIVVEQVPATGSEGGANGVQGEN
jgi:conjugal transfer pilus assembly protein TraK